MTLHETFGGRILVSPAEAGAALFGWRAGTAHNRVFAGTFPLPLVEIGGKKMVRIADIAAAIGEPLPASSSPATTQEKRRGRGRPRKLSPIGDHFAAGGAA